MKQRIVLAGLCLLAVSSSGASWARGGATAVPPPGRLWLAELQVWHRPERSADAPYDSRDPLVIARQIAAAKAMGIGGFVIDWYGPPAGLANDADRAFTDAATEAVFAEADAQGFWVALLYDEGTLRPAPGRQTEQAIADLQYASRYFGRKSYLRLAGRPAVFVFPYGDVEPGLDWGAIRSALVPMTLLDQDPNPDDPAHDAHFDGFFAWVQPSAAGWADDCSEWGGAYLQWFYATMASESYASKVAVGGAWPGFDDSLAPWGLGRCMSRRGTRVWNRTRQLGAGAGLMMIATWNDYQEGTDIEAGVLMDLDLEEAAPLTAIRSTPLRVTWDPRRGKGVVQVYDQGRVIYEASHAPGVWLRLQPASTYEVKVWTDGAPPLARWVRTRRHDPVPGVTAVPVG